jgi:hypothetical protein
MIPLSLSSGPGGSRCGLSETDASRGDSLDEAGDRFLGTTELATDQGDLKPNPPHTDASPPLHRARMNCFPTAARNIAGEGRDRK